MVMLICTIVAGLVGGFAARFRSWGTALTDLLTGLVAATLFSTVALVILVVWVDLNRFGFFHFLYLLLVVALPIGIAIIATPHLFNAEFKTPLIVWPLLLAALVAVAAGLWGTHVEPNRLVSEERILGATGSRQPLVIGVIADLQTPNIGDHERAARDRVLEGNPDVVVIAGDLYQIDPDELDARLPEFLGWLRELRRNVDDVIIVNGEVDDPAVLEELAEESGAQYLNNELLTLSVDGQDVTFIGFSSTEERPPGEIDDALSQSIADGLVDDDLVIAVSNHPDKVLSYPAEFPIDLTIAGHTNGGLISLPGVGPLLTSSDIPNEVAAGGLHVLNDNPIYVSTGVGLERGQAPQLRFGVRPSVALLTVVPADE